MMPEDRGNRPANAPQPDQNLYRPAQPGAPANPAGPARPYPPQYSYIQPQPAPARAAKASKTGPWLWGGLVVGLVALAVVAVLVVFPLFSRGNRSEADPFAASRSTPAAPVSGALVATKPTAVPAGMGQPAAPATTNSAPYRSPAIQALRKGDFTKIDAIHYARGSAIVGIGSDGKKVLRFENFTSAQGPDLKVYLGKNADGSQVEEGGLNLGPLPATDGTYNIPLPDDLDLTQYKSVVIWCEAFSVTFSVASLG